MYELAIWSHLKKQGLVVDYTQEQNSTEVSLTFPEVTSPTQHTQLRELVNDLFANLNPVGVASYQGPQTGTTLIMNFNTADTAKGAKQYAQDLSIAYGGDDIQERKNAAEAKKCMKCWGATRNSFKIPSAFTI